MLNALKEELNYGFTENGGIKHNSTLNSLLDLFAFGGAYRNRSDSDVVALFASAYRENPIYATKCLFYLRDREQGQGERRFFRICMRWLANTDVEAASRNFVFIPTFGRWDDLFVLIDTPLEANMFEFIKQQLLLDIKSKTPSLLAKWLKSENTSSMDSRKIAKKTRNYLGMTSAQYRKTLSILRKKINVLERLMSLGEWDKIEFDKIPSKAGLVYSNAFARNDIIKAKYESFINNKQTKVNAKTLYPYEVVQKALKVSNTDEKTKREVANKYWDNLTDYFNGKTFNGLAVCDTSASMRGTPLNVAIALSIYCAERAGGPFANHYISFSHDPQLIEVRGIDFVDKCKRIYKTNLCQNTNLERVFNLLLETAITHNLSQDTMPENIIVISDMEIDCMTSPTLDDSKAMTMMENMREKWLKAGYKMPKLIYWNVDARNNTILDKGENVSFVSGMSPSIFEQILTGKTGLDLCLETLSKDRYSCIF